MLQKKRQIQNNDISIDRVYVPLSILSENQYLSYTGVFFTHNMKYSTLTIKLTSLRNLAM